MEKNKAKSGLVIVYTGNGKGKSTAAFGLCLRAYGHGNIVRIIQFIKGDWPYGEREGLKRLAPQVTMDTLGVGCVGIMGDNKPIESHRQAAQAALKTAKEAILSDEYDTVILDEINVSAHLNLVSVDDVLKLIKDKPNRLNIILTGRYADEKIIDVADLVTEMREIKHPFQSGELARKGIDF